MPLYTLIFLTECNCMSEEAFKVIQEFGDYYLTNDGLYVRMYGGSRAPSLLPKYATDYVLHKEAVRQLYIDGVGNFLFEHKKAVYPAVPFFIGSYKFSRVKQATDFVKELEYFHFGEMKFHRNDSKNKVYDYCKESGVHFEYIDFWDKDGETFHNAKNMTALRKRFKQKIETMGGHGKTADKAKKLEKKEAKKREEDARKLVQEAQNWLRIEEEEKKQAAEEATKKEEEEKKRKEEVEIKRKQA